MVTETEMQRVDEDPPVRIGEGRVTSMPGAWSSEGLDYRQNPSTFNHAFLSMTLYGLDSWSRESGIVKTKS